ncbi:hypothetical protein NMY22_g10135 [Coprinellus aureogranulatus]|nr:hypothetical protein NMY22_g10135 [Coprinellus aureogranulatus]
MSPQTTQQYYLTKVGSYKNLEIREVPVTQPKANEVLVKVHAVSLQYRDYAIATGSYNIGVQEDIVPCSDMAGEVIAVGTDVKEWKEGDRVCANFATDHLSGPPTAEIAQTSLGGQAPGVLTQYRSFPAHSLVRIPDHLTYAQASTLPCAALTAYNGLTGGANPLKAGDTVLVQGTGGVSIFALQFAVASGATVIATSSSDEKLKLVQKWGAKHHINYRTTPDWEKCLAGYLPPFSPLSPFLQPRLAVSPVSRLLLLEARVRYGGNVALIGFVTGGDSRSDIIDVRGIYIGSVTQFKDMVRLIEANPEKTIPVVDKVFPFEDAIGAYAHLESQKHVGKVVIQVAKP